jgi:molecular chaperone GrpE (heat shock protein)
VLKQNSVERYNPLGEPFDYNVHNAAFKISDPTKEPNTVGVVMKVRWRYFHSTAL